MRVFVAATTIVMSTALLGGASPSGGTSGPEMVLTHGAYRHYGFTISGTSPRGLYPGAVKPIRLTLVNPSAFSLRVTAVRGRLTATSRPGCRPISSNLSIGGFTGRLPITMRPASRKSVGSVAVSMPNSVANACQGATFTILLTGDATKVGR